MPLDIKLRFIRGLSGLESDFAVLRFNANSHSQGCTFYWYPQLEKHFRYDKLDAKGIETVRRDNCPVSEAVTYSRKG